MEKSFHENISSFVERNLGSVKVIWKRIAGGITGKAVHFASAVIGPSQGSLLEYTKPIVLNDSLIMIPLNDENEAHYVCSILNSSIVRSIIASYTYELRMETHITQFIKVPKFNRNSSNHKKLSELSKIAHRLATQGYTEELLQVEKDIDMITSEIYGLNNDEYQDCVKSLEILSGQFEEVIETEKNDSYLNGKRERG